MSTRNCLMYPENKETNRIQVTSKGKKTVILPDKLEDKLILSRRKDT